eukprot:c18027_g1_i1.p2 GENE.c18027_g1_i1~~c18027_g1_i1.p2  ORF type:complete len:161 (+),score=30.90 c18027_g1_i1:246-728(+)
MMQVRKVKTAVSMSFALPLTQSQTMISISTHNNKIKLLFDQTKNLSSFGSCKHDSSFRTDCETLLHAVKTYIQPELPFPSSISAVTKEANRVIAQNNFRTFSLDHIPIPDDPIGGPLIKMKPVLLSRSILECAQDILKEPILCDAMVWRYKGLNNSDDNS